MHAMFTAQPRNAKFFFPQLASAAVLHFLIMKQNPTLCEITKTYANLEELGRLQLGFFISKLVSGY